MSKFEFLSNKFQRFAELEARGYSDLYETITQSVAGDDEMLRLAGNAPQGQPVPNLLLASVQYLLLNGQSHALADYYPNFTDGPLNPREAYPAFREFALQNAETIARLLQTRRVQTNEVGRCNYLSVVFPLISRLSGNRPLALIEIGTSAGLNLLWDKYGYDYAGLEHYGDPQSPLQLTCELRGDKRPPLPDSVPDVVFRVGLDINPLDVRIPEDALWLQSLVWPDHRHRAKLLRSAIEVVRRDPPELIAGDGLELLPDVVARAPENAAICVFHTHTLNQVAPERREQFSKLLRELATKKSHLYRVSVEGFEPPHPRLELTSWSGGEESRRTLAFCHPHGQWVEWLDDGDVLTG